jgi:hypothetical protein
MSEPLSVEEVAEAMYEMVKANHGKRNLKPMDLNKAMIEKFGADRCDKDLCKRALRTLIDPGRCIYSYFGGSYVTLPPEDERPG